MDAHIASIQASLDAIHAQQAQASSQSSYFSNAVLNTPRLDILELIRDADPMEASLFSYAPRAAEEGRVDTEAVLIPREPRLKEIELPSPLRNGVAGLAPDKGARFYLTIADQLMQTFHNAPRARKHVRMLLKRDGELQRHIQRYTLTIDQAKRAKEHQTPQKHANRDEEAVAQIKDEIQRERMEILALESMLAELGRAETPAKAPPKTAPAKPHTTPKASAARTQAPASMAGTPYNKTPTGKLRRTLDGTPRVGRAELRPTLTTPQKAPAPAPSTPERSTPRALQPSPQHTAPCKPSPQRPQLLPAHATPPPSEKLVQVTSKLWALFGETLRYVTGPCEPAPFAETYTIVRKLECCAQDPDTAAVDAFCKEAVPAAPPAASTTTAAPLSVGMVVMAHVLLLLLRAPEHTLTLPSIKTYTDKWWRQRGQGIFCAAMRDAGSASETVRQLGLDARDVELGGDALASRAAAQ
ncbi:hypothetical protein MVES_002278 [Malassezia vespertilionis]|uniref:Uncharacterized protein n=1 Tax=Malassezia vespertilionis TaxID=2020962 RepID=A0A2N1JBJ4_9BASI|nr:hypothetical protein MVES_002278 [Malassezia vespertilionis]